MIQPAAYRRSRRAWLAAWLLAIAGGAAYAWFGLKLRHEVCPRNFGVVEPGRIYRSAQLHRRLVERTLAAHGIRTVIDLSADVPGDPNEAAEREAIDRLGCTRHEIGGLDGDGIGDARAYAEALRRMAAAKARGEPVLIHCMSGAQRTGGAVALYRLLVEGASAQQAREELLRYGHRPARNPRLIPFLNEQMPEVAELLVAMGVIAHQPIPLPRLEAD